MELKFKANSPKLLVDTNGDGQAVFAIKREDVGEARGVFKQISKDEKWAKVDLTIDIKKYSCKRSLDANAYFHVLVGKIANVLTLRSEDVKVQMVLDYGTPETDEFGKMVGFKLPVGQEQFLRQQCPYIKNFGEEKGKKGVLNYWILYKRTSDLTSAEMAKLINGVVEECKQLDIETRTPNEIAEMVSMWGGK